jgi:hypothetical protein
LTFFSQNYWVPAAIVGYSTFIVVTYSFVVLALSSLSRSSRFAGINFAAVFFFSQILYLILQALFRTTTVAWISLGNNLTQAGDLIFGSNPKYASPEWVSLLILALLVTGSAWIVHRRIRAVEVVS